MAVAKTLRKTAPARNAVDHANNVEQAVSDAAAGIALSAIPDAKYAAKYISRTINGKHDLDVLSYAHDRGFNVLIFGPTGPGKTTFTMAWGATHQKRFYSVPSNIAIDPSQLFGKWGQDEHGRFVWYDGGVTDIVRHGGVILINEVNFMPERIATVLFGLLDNRREITLLDHKGERIRAHRPDCWCDLDPEECEERWVLIVADMNPDYSGTRPLNPAFRNRFAIQLNWDYDPMVEAQLVKSGTLLKIAGNIRKTIASGRVETPCATNMLEEFEAIAAEMGVDFAVKNFCDHFGEDERVAVKGVFDSLMADLVDDFTPDTAADWNQYENGKDSWIQDGE